MEFVMVKKLRGIFQFSTNAQVVKLECQPIQERQPLSDKQIKEILSAGSSLTRGVIKKS